MGPRAIREQTGDVESCIVTPAGIRISKVYIYMGQGGVQAAPVNKLSAPPCTKFDDSSSCIIGYGSPHGPLSNYISTTNQQVVCAYASAERGTGTRYWGMVGGD